MRPFLLALINLDNPVKESATKFGEVEFVTYYCLIPEGTVFKWQI